MPNINSGESSIRQSRRMSAIETATNIPIGFVVSWLLGFYLLPIWGFEQSGKAVTTVTIIYTVASIVRSYTVRRAFNLMVK